MNVRFLRDIFVRVCVHLLGVQLGSGRVEGLGYTWTSHISTMTENPIGNYLRYLGGLGGMVPLPLEGLHATKPLVGSMMFSTHPLSPGRSKPIVASMFFPLSSQTAGSRRTLNPIKPILASISSSNVPRNHHQARGVQRRHLRRLGSQRGEAGGEASSSAKWLRFQGLDFGLRVEHFRASGSGFRFGVEAGIFRCCLYKV